MNKEISIGDKFNYLEVRKKGSGHGSWICYCLACNSLSNKEIRGTDLRRGSVKSCGCQGFRKKNKIKTGDIFGGWKVVSPPKKNSSLIICKCTKCETMRDVNYVSLIKQVGDSCGCATNTSKLISGTIIGHWQIQEKSGRFIIAKCLGCQVVKKIDSQSLLRGESKSCGCMNAEYTKKAFLSNYGASHYSRSKEARDLRIENIYIKLQDGRIVSELCKEKGISTTSGLAIFRDYGESNFLEYYENYQKNIYSTEAAFISLFKNYFDIEKYDKEPKEFKITRRPDFRIEQNQKILYINIDGLYWHSENNSRNLSKDYHLSLRQDFSAHNQTIFQFRGDELRDKPNIVRSIVLNYFNIYKNTYYARKCLIKQVSTKEADLFYSQNHLMGKYSSAKHFGLYYNDTLVAMMSTKLNKKDNSLEIARYCNLLETKVPGGFSKLLKHVENIYNPSKVISFCDLRYASGHTYTKLGFTLERTTLGWSWTDFQNTYNRLKCRANMDDRKLTQAEHAKELKLSKIYDAGQAKYVKEII